MIAVLGALAAVPLALIGLLWLRQERMIFMPDTAPITGAPGWNLERLAVPDGTNLAFLVAGGAAGQPVILHFHGNGGSVQDRLGLGAALNRAGYGVVLAEYRGYGGNAGRPGETAFAADAPAYLAWVRARFPGRAVVLWGESLGTSVVTRLAEGRGDVMAVILESPFTSVADLARSIYPMLPVDWLLRHPFESLARMPRVTAPVLVVASEEDPITPLGHARRMVAAAANGQLVVLRGGAHPAVLNAADGEAVGAVLRFLAR